MRKYILFFGAIHVETAQVQIENSKNKIYNTSKAIIRCRKILHFKNKCFIEAITAKIILKQKGLASTLYIGIRKDDQKVIAHAWLRCGNTIVVGGKEMKSFKVVTPIS